MIPVITSCYHVKEYLYKRFNLSSYARERRNYKKLKKSGAGKHFTPKWFVYELLSFLRDKNKPRKSLQAGCSGETHTHALDQKSASNNNCSEAATTDHVAEGQGQPFMCSVSANFIRDSLGRIVKDRSFKSAVVTRKVLSCSS
nr:unnamed protein product [Callosobruchus chinensis]